MLYIFLKYNEKKKIKGGFYFENPDLFPVSVAFYSKIDELEIELC